MLKRFPEVVTVVSKTGRAEIATDPMGVEISDVLVMLKPHKQWTTAESRDDLIAVFDSALAENMTGTIFSYSQPIELRVSELIAGVRSDVALMIFGDSLEVLADAALDGLERCREQLLPSGPVLIADGQSWLACGLRQMQHDRFGRIRLVPVAAHADRKSVV